MPEEALLAEQLRQSRGPDSAVTTRLSTNERVIARVTDGIYREPGSAIRELISNAYDADATRVTVKTDVPRFAQLSIEDNGRGMSPESLAYLIQNIGGSAKRTVVGQELGISRSDDASRSPSGRQLIGMLGIGIFSVSQLTRTFQIVTKVKGDSFRSVALVRLHQFSEATVSDLDEAYDAGDVTMWREPTTDTDQHGTSVVLTGIRPQTRDSLRSADIWDAFDLLTDEELESNRPVGFVPKYYVGRVDENAEYRDERAPGLVHVPWDERDAPDVAFKKMVDSVWGATTEGNPNPKLDMLFDNYLKMVWDLSLAVPVRYSHGHLFDEPAGDWAGFYRVSNETRGHAEPLDEQVGRVRDLMDLEDGTEPALEFRVFVDDLELLRPIRFRHLPVTAHALKRPLVFLGKLRQDFDGFPSSISAGPLAFEAYLFWTPKVAPVDHRGVLVRIYDASGALFDHTFFRYQVSEQVRLRQIVCEIFVTEGLESALNIDREAFNTAHPHMVVLTKWLHSALRQLATAQKSAAQSVRLEHREEFERRAESRLHAVLDAANMAATGGEGLVPDVEFGSRVVTRESRDDRPEPIGESIVHRFSGEVLRPGGRQQPLDEVSTRKLGAIVQVMSVFGLLDELGEAEQVALVSAIAEVIGLND